MQGWMDRLNDISFDDILPFINKPLGIHHIRTKLFSIPLASLQRLYNRCLNTYIFDTSSLYKLNSIILDIANCRMFKPVNSDIPNESPRKFLNMKFANKGIDAINIGNILDHRDDVKNIPSYF